VIGANHRTANLRIELVGELGRTDEIGEHDGERRRSASSRGSARVAAG
jgi:hypothetical protein